MMRVAPRVCVVAASPSGINAASKPLWRKLFPPCCRGQLVCVCLRRRSLEPLSIIVFAALMGLASLELIINSIEDLAKGAQELKIDILTWCVLGTRLSLTVCGPRPTGQHSIWLRVIVLMCCHSICRACVVISVRVCLSRVCCLMSYVISGLQPS